jgi:hypothetical protein
MRNLDVIDTREKLLTYAKAGLIALGSGTELPLLPATSRTPSSGDESSSSGAKTSVPSEDLRRRE